MKKTLFTAALALVLSLGGFASFAQAQQTASDSSAATPAPWQLDLVFKAKNETSLKKGLASLADNKKQSFGYKITVDDQEKFVSLSTILGSEVTVSTNEKGEAQATFKLGEFQKDDALQFGFSNEDFSTPNSTLMVASDAGFYAKYDINSFYHEDFSKDPFDGKIDIYVMGEPLPASTVTLLVALAAAAAILLYNNRRTRVRLSEQA